MVFGVDWLVLQPLHTILISISGLASEGEGQRGGHKEQMLHYETLFIMQAYEH